MGGIDPDGLREGFGAGLPGDEAFWAGRPRTGARDARTRYIVRSEHRYSPLSRKVACPGLPQTVVDAGKIELRRLVVGHLREDAAEPGQRLVQVAIFVGQQTGAEVLLGRIT